MRLKESKFKNFSIFLIPLILSIGIVPGLSYADSSEAPDDQIEDGFLPHEVSCEIGKELIIRNNGKAACVFEETADEWEEDEMGITDPLLQCKSGNVHLQNPGTGAIICQGQSSFQKFVDQGWVALDGPPAEKETKVDQCRAGQIHILIPNLGTIICRTPADAQRYIDAGWEPLEELPTFSESGAAQCGPTRVAMAGDITGTVVCVRSQSVDLYKSHGYTLVVDEPITGDPTMFELTGCRGGTFHLQNPDSGIIMCAKQSIVPRYLDRVWVALDELPFM